MTQRRKSAKNASGNGTCDVWVRDMEGYDKK